MTEISIVIPSYRRPDMLERAVDSCLAQQGVDVPFEIVVVDNDPAGSARPVIERLAARSAVPVRYLAEPRPGISHARNTGIANAAGRHLAFMDDDEEADPGWLAALIGTMRRYGGDVVKGPVLPRLEDCNPYARKIYTRDARVPTGTVLADATGTGNALFDRERCFAGNPTPFDPFLGLAGGGDTLFFRQLLRAGRKIVWCAEAVVRETVPPDRVLPRYVLRRRFRHGQVTTFVRMAAQPAQPAQVALWMAIGAAQMLLYAPAGALLWALKNERWLAMMGQAASGVGKVLWHPKMHLRLYRRASG
ncbi:MAG: glycosyltransferase family 2 protein [Thiohalocapsa sp.]